MTIDRRDTAATTKAFEAPVLQHVAAQRVLAADHGGSSWPVLVETDRGVWFTKLRGAGQGTGALVAEIIVAELAARLGLSVPTRALVELPREIESLNRRDELRDLLTASTGLNLGFAYLDGARMFVPADAPRVSGDDAAAIVWLDAFVMNPDRTARNPNMMWWRERLWLIDHGVALGFQYAWENVNEDAPARVFRPRQPHVLASRVSDMAAWDEMLAERLTRESIARALAAVPDDFLAAMSNAGGQDLDRRRAAYVAYLWKRLKAPRMWAIE